LINAPSSCVGASAESSQLQASVAFSSDQNCEAADHAYSQHSSANDACTVHDAAIGIEVAGAAQCIRRLLRSDSARPCRMKLKDDARVLTTTHKFDENFIAPLCKSC
jgi:hypothetical protein